LVEFKVLTPATMKMAVFPALMSCSLKWVYHCYRRSCCLHYIIFLVYYCFGKNVFTDCWKCVDFFCTQIWNR